MRKPIACCAFLVSAGLATWFAWRFVIPTVFESPRNLETVAAGRAILDEITPLNASDVRT